MPPASEKETFIRISAGKDKEKAVKAVDLKLTEEEIRYLEELYVPHALVGVMAQNGRR